MRVLILLMAVAGAGCGGGGGGGGMPEPQAPDLPLAAGDATATEVVLWALATALGDVFFEVASDEDFNNVVATRTETATATDLPVKTTVTPLTAGAWYHYRATDQAGVTGAGRFRMPRAPGSRGGLRFGVSGDSRGELAPFPSVRNAAGRDLDFFVLLGDTIYADVPSPAVPAAQATTLDEFRRKHDEVLSGRFGLNTLGALRANTLVYGDIDDHEVTNDFSGGAPPASDPRFPPAGGETFINETPLFMTGLQAFQEYYPLQPETYAGTDDPDNAGNPDPRMEGKPKLYRFRRFGDDAAMFLLDARSFRSEPVPSLPIPPTAQEIDDFIAAAYATTDTLGRTRTMLGAQQLADLQTDLMAAHAAGVTWKFVFTPEPAQNLGPILAEDRFEGYGAERDALMRWIDDNDIDNVVFVAADIHGTIANNLTYQIPPAVGPGMPLFDVPNAFGITSGPIAFDKPFGPTVVDVAEAAGLISANERALYDQLSMSAQDDLVKTAIDDLLGGDPAMGGFGYDPTGLPPSQATLLAGDYVRVHNYGWTEFEIDAATRRLTVTVYGIEPYDETQAAAAAGRQPQVLLRFTVDAAP